MGIILKYNIFLRYFLSSHRWDLSPDNWIKNAFAKSDTVWKKSKERQRGGEGIIIYLFRRMPANLRQRTEITETRRYLHYYKSYIDFYLSTSIIFKTDCPLIFVHCIFRFIKIYYSIADLYFFRLLSYHQNLKQNTLCPSNWINIMLWFRLTFLDSIIVIFHSNGNVMLNFFGQGKNGNKKIILSLIVCFISYFN